MALRISRELLERIVAQARAEAPAECCGLLLGDASAFRVDAVRPAANVAAEPLTRFELDPAVLLAAHRQARMGGPAILGHYHSHPRGPGAPSEADAACASGDGAVWLIADGEGTVTAWRALATGHHHDRFEPCEIRVVDEPGRPCALASSGRIGA